MNSLLIGLWFFNSVIYHGSILPRPNQALVMSLNFADDGTDILRYERTGEKGFCERKALFSFDGKSLQQTVLSVNSDNDSSCDQDTDMRVGTISYTPLHVDNQQLFLELGLGDENIVLIWGKSLETK